MKKVYLLEELDCPNCAMKVEKKVSKIKGITEVNVDFAQKKMYIEGENDTLVDEIIETIKAIEPDIRVKEISSKKLEVVHEHHEEHQHRTAGCGCGHHHEEHEHEPEVCGCGHHHEEHEHEPEGCGCGHHHEEYEHKTESCGCGHHHEEHEHKTEGCSCGHSHDHHEEEKVINENTAMKFRIEGLDCANCAQKVEDALSKQPNVKEVSLSFSNGLLFVNVEQKESIDLVQKRFQSIIDSIEKGVTLQRMEEVKDDKKDHSQRNEVIRLFCSILVFVIALCFDETTTATYLYALAFVISGGKVILTAIRNILRGEVFDENFLMSIATIGAFMIGSYQEGVEVMIFYEIGELFQSYAVNRSRKSISSLMNIRAEYANRLNGDKEERVTPEEVRVDDIILIRPGERVPLDGILIKGETSLDTSALTGESLPRDVEEQDEILAGTVNLTGLIQVRVTSEFKESTVSRILELVENAGSKKAPMEKFITKFARIYTPIVVCLAIAVAVLPMLLIEDAVFYDWLYRALTFLVVSCPCALVVSIPLGLFAGIGGASKKGILIKGGNYLEALSEVETVVFDKTGTLTKGSFHVEQVVCKAGSEEELLMLGAYGEAYSNHPIAQSIVKAYGKTMDKTKLQEFEEIAGNGISVSYENQKMLLGNTKLMKANGIAYDQNTPIGTIIHIAKNNVYMGYIVINDEIKETSEAAILALKKQGVKKCVMLTGDRQEVAQAVANKLHLDEVYAQLLPVDKVEKVEALLQQKGNGKLAFVGDGINDAPVLARADIGVAMGGIGSDAAIEAADIVLMKDDPKALAEAIHLSKKTKRILWQNIVFSLGIKIAVLILTVFGLSTMQMGVFADVGVTLLAIINSMRALKA